MEYEKPDDDAVPEWFKSAIGRDEHEADETAEGQADKTKQIDPRKYSGDGYESTGPFVISDENPEFTSECS
jgi:hypothetical protein